MYTSCFCAVTAAAAAARTVELYSIILHATHTLKVALKAVNKFFCHHLVRSANLPEGLYVLPSVISIFCLSSFLMISRRQII